MISQIKNQLIIVLGLTTLLNPAYAFNSGSTGADGAFSPTVSQQVTLPANGVFNFTTVNIPSGVIITFTRNAANTPVTILASGDVVVEGEINVNGLRGDSLDNDSGQNFFSSTPGGPGGFDGGRGGLAGTRGGNGQGPGGGIGYSGTTCYGGGASYGSRGDGSCAGSRSSIYGSVALLPLIGGSGGGGGAATSIPGASGGGGGGAILIASSGTLTINGAVRANGGRGGVLSANAADGGGGSGGAIRLVASMLTGSGSIQAVGSRGGNSSTTGRGGVGRVRLEADNFSFASNSSPTASFSQPRGVTLAGMPALSITSVNGITVPAIPNGFDDVRLPASTVSPLDVIVRATNVPLGLTVNVRVTPSLGTSTSVASNALTGTTAISTATASVSLPVGPSTMLATAVFPITETQSQVLSKFTNGERVAQVELSTGENGVPMTRLVTVSGKYFDYATLPSQI